ncbi:patatin-like phospholipase family protein [Mycolicibacterium komossense]|uniref:Patatin-like phospholipase family protein n=1 Tax=Mycolicibacterium komossense TaxID=1779 RepID=A0ABT3C5W9_9MYCO|nr:patatin-like phospholipase family protein [Mycolicibacterium komossense]MCV7224596.1 patatin-like phospholipase family protein [Mycolicibacterium komossense]
MSRSGLVLAGGGLAGIAWETGILRGIADEIPAAADALLDADVLVGTSAGSTVAAQIGSGLDIEELYDRQTAEATFEIDSGVDIERITELFTGAMTPGTTAAQRLQRIGAIALATDTVAGPVRRSVIEQRLPSHDWPNRTLRITGIDVATGELVVFDNTSGVQLVDAVAASCAVPGVWPPVRIPFPAGERIFIDGGTGSSVNMVAANDCDAVVVLVPSGRDAPSPFSAGVAAEIADFSGATLALFADDDALAAFGPNPLDPRCRIPSARAGREQGRRHAGTVAEFLAR